jgi:hypothetical protein
MTGGIAMLTPELLELWRDPSVYSAVAAYYEPGTGITGCIFNPYLISLNED